MSPAHSHQQFNNTVKIKVVLKKKKKDSQILININFTIRLDTYLEQLILNRTILFRKDGRSYYQLHVKPISRFYY